MKRYTEEHEWLEIEGEVATVGISFHAQEALGDITFVELPEVGKSLDKGDSFSVVESVKAASDVYAPLAGEVVEVNQALEANPQLLNEAPEGEGWLVKLKLTDTAGIADFMDKAAYDAFVASQD